MPTGDFKFACETCRDTGYYGDNGPGIKGNGEYHRCDQCKVEPPAPDELDTLRRQLAAANEKAKQYLSDWYAAKNEFGNSAAMLRTEVAKYRGMEVENAGLKTDNEAYIERIAELLDKITALEEELHQVRMNWDAALKAELAKRDEPLTDEQASKVQPEFPSQAKHWDAAIRRVRRGE